MSNRISFEVNNGGTLTFEQNEHDGPVDAIVWETAKKDEDGIIKREVRHGYEISPGDMVLLFDYYVQQKDRGEPIL